MDTLGKTESLIANDFFAEQDFNCAETVLAAASEAYEWNLTHDARRLAAGFGGGVGGQELLCGALSGGVMALGRLFVEERAHESDLIKTVIQHYFALFKEEMGHIDCVPLKEKYRTETEGCKQVIQASTRCLDRTIHKYKDRLPK